MPVPQVLNSNLRAWTDMKMAKLVFSDVYMTFTFQSKKSVGDLPLVMVSIFNYLRHLLHKYANEDVSLGSWFIGLDVEHVDDRRLCCGTPPGKIQIYATAIMSCFNALLNILLHL